jgi:hypothetical protein
MILTSSRRGDCAVRVKSHRRDTKYHFCVILKCKTLIGPSGVRALPLTAGINIGGYYFWYFSSSYLILSSASVDGGLRGGSSVRIPWSEDPHLR